MSKATSYQVENPWAVDFRDVLDALDTSAGEGLSDAQFHDRLNSYGPNQLKKHKKRSVLTILVDQFKSIIIALLILAALFAFWLGEYIDGWAIVVVILINTLIGFFTEFRAVRSMEALFKLGKVTTRVRRNGKVKEIDAEELVPGDIVILEGGDIITADMRIIESSKLQADESPLTGESLPVTKGAAPLEEETVLAERANMLYKGTYITRGSGEGVVVQTGLQTELGQISSLVEEAKGEQTPLEERLDKLGYRLIAITLLIAIFVSISGIVAGKNLYLMIETGIALAVAAIPEGLPIVATIALAKGMRIMAEKNALINRLSSVETLGATGIICTDKTGTLTENKMTVTHLYLPQKEITVDGDEASSFVTDGRQLDIEGDNNLRLALEAGALCNNANLFEHKDGGTGDPLEVALLDVARKADIDIDDLGKKYPEVREEAFDADIKMMATWNRLEDGKFRVHVKGAPGSVLQKCDSVIIEENSQPMNDDQRKHWEQINEELASKGLRMIALATKIVDDTNGDPYKELSWVGLAALSDPPRKDVKPAIEKCREAGIRVVMITGDQVATARFIAQSLGLHDGESMVIHGADLPDSSELEASLTETKHVLKASIFARISPRQKLDLIEFYQKHGNIVAMTGDGVNDAPALKKADIGIAMGQRGTQVAREAADMVLTDDAFSTIVKAIEQGRVIFGNIGRFIYYLMSCNISEVLVVGLASMLGTPLPILPLQILFLNLVTDVFPALALGVGEGERGVMQRPPREPDHPILDRSNWIGIASYGLVITFSVLGSLLIALEYLQLSVRSSVTISFMTLAMAQLWHVFNMREDSSGFWDNAIIRNPFVWYALLLCVGILLVALYVPGLAAVLQIIPPNLPGWLTIIGMSLIPLVLGQLRKMLI